MVSKTTAKWRPIPIIALASVAALVAGCGSSSSANSSSGTATAQPAAASSTTSSTAAASGIMIGTAKSHGMTYLTGAGGRAIYLWKADTGEQSNCSGACASAWPPVITKGKPTAGAGVNAADLGTTTRTDGSEEVTYKGHPLYYFVADTSPGSTKGQGSDSFGAKWWLVAPSGSAITSAKSGSSSSGSSSGSGWG